jgi:hypothetical protein
MGGDGAGPRGGEGPEGGREQAVRYRSNQRGWKASVVQWTSCWGLSVGVFAPETTILEYHLLTVDVVTKTPPTKSQPVLPFALGDAFEFEDLVAMAMIIGVCAENRECVRIGIH